ncbi:MAG: TonB-dependent receptor [Alphaproteobacteria bacterium]|nr:MAG: TonB-dependent receptor [Alphaproteobacteria bacterium]
MRKWTATALALVLTSPAFAIDEITVTATKRPMPLQTLVGNTASLKGEELLDLSFDHPAEALNRLPGVDIHHNNGQEHLTGIRSPVLTAGAGAGSFLFAEDGIPLRAPGFANVNGLFDAHGEQAARMEVVRGPGSALYGSNAVHGLVNVLTRNPLDDKSSFLDVSSGSHLQSTGKFLYTSPGESSAYNLALTLKHDDGWRDDSGYDQQKATFRWDQQSGDRRMTAVLSGNNLNQETAGFIEGPKAYEDLNLAKSNPNPEAYRDAKSLHGFISLAWDEGDRTTTLTPYFRVHDMNFLMHFLPGKPREENEHKSLGIQLRRDQTFDAHQVIYGLDIDLTKGSLYEYQDGPQVFSYTHGLHYDYEVTAKSASPYLHTEWQLSEATKLVAGLRLDVTRYDYDNKADVVTVGRFQRIADRSDTFTTLTPKLGITHAVADEINLFARYARGQRAPQTTDLYRLQIKQEVGEIKSELLDSIEVGARDAIGPVTWEVTAFAMKKKNFFFRDSDGFNVPDGRTKHWGVELSGAAPLGGMFSLSGALTYAEHTYDFNNLVAANSTEDIARGNFVDTAPKWLGNLRLNWTPSETFRTELEWVHMGRYFTDGANTNDYDGHDVLNLRAFWDVTDTVTLYGRIENIADTAYAERADFAFGNERYFPGEERSFFVGIRKAL